MFFIYNYSFAQAVKIIKKKKLITLILILCYTVGMIFPTLFFAYRHWLVDRASDDSLIYDNRNNYSIFINITSIEQFNRIRDLDEIKEMMSFDENIQISSVAFDQSISDTVVIDNEIVPHQVRWSYSQHPSGFVYGYDQSVVTGQTLSDESPNDVLIGSLGLSRGYLKNIIGKTVVISGQNFRISGIADGAKGIIGNINSVYFCNTVVLNFHIPTNLSESSKEIFKLFAKDYDVFGQNNIENMNKYYKDAQNEGNRYVILGIVVLFFCVTNSYSVVNALLQSVKNNVLIKMSLGASIKNILYELFAYFLIINMTASLLSVYLCSLIKNLVVRYTRFGIMFDYTIIIYVFILSVAVSMFISLLSVRRLSKMNLSVIVKG